MADKKTETTKATTRDKPGGFWSPPERNEDGSRVQQTTTVPTKKS
jgi:hypothetical protein